MAAKRSDLEPRWTKMNSSGFIFVKKRKKYNSDNGIVIGLFLIEKEEDMKELKMVEMIPTLMGSTVFVVMVAQIINMIF